MGRGGVAGGLVGFVGVRMDTVGCHNLYVTLLRVPICLDRYRWPILYAGHAWDYGIGWLRAPILEVRAWSSSFGCLTEAPCCSACG